MHPVICGVAANRTKRISTDSNPNYSLFLSQLPVQRIYPLTLFPSIHSHLVRNMLRMPFLDKHLSQDKSSRRISTSATFGSIMTPLRGTLIFDTLHSQMIGVAVTPKANPTKLTTNSTLLYALNFPLFIAFPLRVSSKGKFSSF